jgi:hypothetical protein
MRLCSCLVCPVNDHSYLLFFFLTIALYRLLWRKVRIRQKYHSLSRSFDASLLFLYLFSFFLPFFVDALFCSPFSPAGE